jgi:cell division protein FtsW
MKTKSNQFLQGIDPIILISFGILILLGLVILQTASSVISFLEYKDPYYYFVQQLIRGVIPGIILFVIFAKFPYQWLRKLTLIGFLITLGINCLVFIPSFATVINGATRWVQIGGFSFQPSELLKLALLLYLAILLTQFKHTINAPSKLFFVLGVIVLSVGLVVKGQSNLSTGILLTAISGSMLFQSSLKLKYLGILVIIGIIGALLFIRLEPYRWGRAITYLEGQEQDKLGKGYQIDQSLIAVGSGGVLGLGWSQSRQKFLYVPEAKTDSIFAIFGEEAGLIGITILMSIFAVTIFRIIWLSVNVKDDFARYILIGAATWLSLQIFFNIGATIKLIPVTGVTLPFISYGSTSILILCVLFGIIANISTHRI